MQAKSKYASGFTSKLKTLLYWINILLVLLTLISYASPFISPSKIWHFSFLGLAYPYLLLGNVFFIVFWVWQKDLYALYSTGCILAGFGYFSSFVGWHCTEPPVTGDAVIRMMTYNVAGLRRYDERTKEEKTQRRELLDNLVASRGEVDILCIQEGASSQVTKVLRKAFGFKHHFKYKGTIIFSRFPFVNQDNIDFGETTNSCIWADLRTPHGIVRVYSAHLQSNWLGATAVRLRDDPDPRKKETWKSLGQLLRLYKRAAARRANQVERMVSHIAESPYPVIVGGDLNDTPVSYVYQKLADHLQDSFREKGCGLDFTYNGKIPGLRIDYVFSDETLHVLSHEVPVLELSDHYPVLVKLGFDPK